MDEGENGSSDVEGTSLYLNLLLDDKGGSLIMSSSNPFQARSGNQKR